jgi:hypothetical protein
MLEMIPRSDLSRPDCCGHKFRRDYESVAAVSVADEVGECSERSCALAGTKWRNEKSGVALV